MASATANFWSDNLQESIQTAGQQAKTLLCFVTDDTETSGLWNDIITSQDFRSVLQNTTVRLRLRKDTEEFGFLAAICPVQSPPALILINGGQIEERLDASSVSPNLLKEKLLARYGSTQHVEEATDKIGDVEEVEEAGRSARSTTKASEYCLELPPSTGVMRLPNNAYDSLRERTEKLRKSKISPKNILALQLRLMDNVPSVKSYVQDVRSQNSGTSTKIPEDVKNRLLNTPASALQPRQPTPPSITSSSSATLTPNTNLTPTSSTAPSPSPEMASHIPPASQPQNQPSQRADYIRQQRDRESSQRSERDRIKAQIKADREERRRLDAIRKQSEPSAFQQQNSTTSSSASTIIRVQIRTFDGSTIRTTFPKTATITNDVRPWIDRTNPDAKKAPYDLKLILTPLPNRNIETSEEERALPELGIVGSATLIMVPVQGFVESYSGASSSVAGSVIGGVIGIGGSVVNGVLGMLGWGSSSAQSQPTRTDTSVDARAGDASGSSVKVRTLADQRADENRKRGNQLYNGNSLDFQGRKDDEDNRKQD